MRALGRILHVTREAVLTGPGAGGLERALEGLSAAQSEAGYDVAVLPVPARQLEAAGERALNGDWEAVAEIGETLLENHEPAILHCHDWYGAPVLEAFIRRGRRAAVITSHLPLRRGFTYRDSGASWTAKNLLETRAFDLSGAIVCPSWHIVEFLAGEYGVSADRLHRIGHGVDPGRFAHAAEPSAQEGDVKLLAVGRLTEQKGFELLLRALPPLRRARPSLKLEIVGEGEREGTLRRLVGQMGLEDCVELRPSVDTKTLAGLYSRATLMIMPSLFEPFGLVALEALACGCPVLALAPSGAEEFLLAEELAPSPSPSRLALAIERRLEEVTSSGFSREDLRARALCHGWAEAARGLGRVYAACGESLPAC